MTTTRRELLQLSSASLGSIALLGLTGREMFGGQPKRGQGPQLPLYPFIKIENIISGMTLGFTFTVRGSYSQFFRDKDGNVIKKEGDKPLTDPPPITCVLRHSDGTSAATGSVNAGGGNWMADFTYEHVESQMKILASMTVGTEVFTSEVIEISISADPGIGIGGSGLMADQRAIGAKAKPHGTMGMYITQVTSAYFEKGKPIGKPTKDSMKLDRDLGTWNSQHDFTANSTTDVSHVVIGFGWDEETGRIQLVSCSKTKLKVEV